MSLIDMSQFHRIQIVDDPPTAYRGPPERRVAASSVPLGPIEEWNRDDVDDEPADGGTSGGDTG